jgi:hypothetical protein
MPHAAAAATLATLAVHEGGARARNHQLDCASARLLWPLAAAATGHKAQRQAATACHRLNKPSTCHNVPGQRHQLQVEANATHTCACGTRIQPASRQPTPGSCVAACRAHARHQRRCRLRADLHVLAGGQVLNQRAPEGYMRRAQQRVLLYLHCKPQRADANTCTTTSTSWTRMSHSTRA